MQRMASWHRRPAEQWFDFQIGEQRLQAWSIRFHLLPGKKRKRLARKVSKRKSRKDGGRGLILNGCGGSKQPTSGFHQGFEAAEASLLRAPLRSLTAAVRR